MRPGLLSQLPGDSRLLVSAETPGSQQEHASLRCSCPSATLPDNQVIGMAIQVQDRIALAEQYHETWAMHLQTVSSPSFSRVTQVLFVPHTWPWQMQNQPGWAGIGSQCGRQSQFRVGPRCWLL